MRDFAQVINEQLILAYRVFAQSAVEPQPQEALGW
jgi:hypothetical protein